MHNTKLHKWYATSHWRGRIYRREEPVICSVAKSATRPIMAARPLRSSEDGFHMPSSLRVSGVVISAPTAARKATWLTRPLMSSGPYAENPMIWSKLSGLGAAGAGAASAAAGAAASVGSGAQHTAAE